MPAKVHVITVQRVTLSLDMVKALVVHAQLDNTQLQVSRRVHRVQRERKPTPLEMVVKTVLLVSMKTTTYALGAQSAIHKLQQLKRLVRFVLRVRNVPLVMQHLLLAHHATQVLTRTNRDSPRVRTAMQGTMLQLQALLSTVKTVFLVNTQPRRYLHVSIVKLGKVLPLCTNHLPVTIVILESFKTLRPRLLAKYVV
jgi:hypothetical protein